jgi:hypothetical protein
VTLDFVDENPSLKGIYSKSTPSGPAHSRGSTPLSATGSAREGSTTPKAHVASLPKHDSAMQSPEVESDFNKSGTSATEVGRKPSSDDEQSPALFSSERSATLSNHEPHLSSREKCVDIPNESSSSWLPHNVSISDFGMSHSNLFLPDAHSGSTGSQSAKVDEFPHWPDMSVQEAYLMRHFIEELACWVSFDILHCELR